MTSKSKSEKTPAKKTNNKSGAEKPISLWGASLPEVIQALLKTKPEAKKKSNKPKQKPSK